MTPNNQRPREPRSRAIFRHTEAAIRSSGLTRQAFACRVADHYQADVSADERIVEFHVGTTTDTIEKANKANDQIIKRFLAGTVKMPADLEESWIAALPEPFRADCERELAQRYGFIGAKAKPSNASAAAALCAGALTVEFGHLLQAQTKIMANSKITAEDAPHLIKARKEYNDLLAELISYGATLDKAIEHAMSQAQTLRVVA